MVCLGEDSIDHPPSCEGFDATSTLQLAHLEWNLQTGAWLCDENVADIFGMKREVDVPSPSVFLALKHPDDLSTSQVMLQSVRSGRSCSYTHRVFRQDGYVRHVKATAHLTVEPHGRPSMMQATLDALSDWEEPISSCDPSTLSDGALMLGLRAQMPEAMSEVFVRHRGNVNRIVRKLGYASINADDIVQDVFEGLCRFPIRFDARRGTLGGYLAMQARSRCIDLGRSQAKRRNRELTTRPLGVTPTAEAEALSALEKEEIRELLANLDGDERIPIELAFFGGLSYRAVADRLGLPEGTVKSRIRRGMQQLKPFLDTEGG